MKDFINLIEEFEKYDVELISLREKLETGSAMGRFLVGIIVLIAEWEAGTISERTIRGIDRSAIEGNYALSGSTPLGYVRNKFNKLEINEEQAGIVNYVFEAISNEKYTMNGIVKHLKRIYGTYNWSEKIVRKMLNNKIYVGKFENKRIKVENHSPAIISTELFDSVQKLQNKRRKYMRYNYLYKERVICDECQKLMVSYPGTSMNRDIYLYYKCNKCRKRISEKEISQKIEVKISRIIDSKIRDYKKMNFEDKRNKIVENNLRIVCDKSGEISVFRIK